MQYKFYDNMTNTMMTCNYFKYYLNEVDYNGAVSCQVTGCPCEVALVAAVVRMVDQGQSRHVPGVWVVVAQCVVVVVLGVEGTAKTAAPAEVCRASMVNHHQKRVRTCDPSAVHHLDHPVIDMQNTHTSDTYKLMFLYFLFIRLCQCTECN